MRIMDIVFGGAVCDAGHYGLSGHSGLWSLLALVHSGCVRGDCVELF